MELTKEQNKIIKTVRIGIWLIGLIPFIFLLCKYLVPNGHYGLEIIPYQKNKLVKNFASKELEKIVGSQNIIGSEPSYQLITTTPVYFDVYVPRSFKKVTATLWYQNPDNQPIIQLGLKQPNGAFYTTDMITAPEVQTELDSEWLTAEATVEVPFLYAKNNYVNFIIGLTGLPEANRQLKIHKVVLSFQRDPITFATLVNKLNSL